MNWQAWAAIFASIDVLSGIGIWAINRYENRLDREELERNRDPANWGV